MADKVYQLKYDDEIDKDIDTWLKSLPRSRKAELVRNAIRFYLQATGEQKSHHLVATAPVLQSTINETATVEEKPKKRPSSKLGGLQ